MSIINFDNKKYLWPIVAVLIIMVAGGLYFLYHQPKREQKIGGDRDSHGCLVAAGYAFDDQVGACIRAFEMTPGIKRAAQIAVDQVGRGYALTVTSFNSYEEPGAYDIFLEQGLERKQQVVYIKNWQAVSTTTPTSTPIVYPDTAHAIQAALATKYGKPLADVHVTVYKEVPGYASGSVLFGQGGPGEGGQWLAVLGNGWSVVWDGNGNVDCAKMRSVYGFPDTILKPNFCN